MKSCQLIFSEISENLPPEYASRSEPASQRAGPLIPQKRPIAQVEPLTPGARALQPRPSAISTLSPSAEPQMNTAYNVVTEQGERPRKKRGRPSKLEVEERIAAAEARGEVYQPPKKRTPKSKQNTMESGHGEMISPYGSTRTPEGQHATEPNSEEWSSGQRRGLAKSDFPGPLLQSAPITSPGDTRPYTHSLYSHTTTPYDSQQAQQSPQLPSHSQRGRSIHSQQQYPESSFRSVDHQQQQQSGPAQQPPSTPDVKMQGTESYRETTHQPRQSSPFTRRSHG